MTVSKETAKKVKRLQKIEEERKRLLEELFAEFKDAFDGCYIEGYDIEDEACGDDQGEGEYCDQWTGYSSDTGSGVYYYPIEGSRKYLAITYNF